METHSRMWWSQILSPTRSRCYWVLGMAVFRHPRFSALHPEDNLRRASALPVWLLPISTAMASWTSPSPTATRQPSRFCRETDQAALAHLQILQLGELR